MINPLVSIVVIAYNSSSTIIETLESVKAQTYRNIELIVTDDCSTDKTLELCERWLCSNSDSFVRAILVKSSMNTGVTANINRGVEKCEGKWIKTIAGDDTLNSDCIQEYISFVGEHPDCRICLSCLRVFGSSKECCNSTEQWLKKDIYDRLKEKSREEQYKTCLYHHIMPGPAIFYQMSLWNEVGRFDERYPGTEEYPFEIKVLSIAKFYFLDKFLVNWRIRPNSLSRSNISRAHDDDRRIFYDIRRPLMIKEGMYLEAWDHTLWYLVRDKIRADRRKWFYSLIMVLSPLWLINNLKSILRKIYQV